MNVKSFLKEVPILTIGMFITAAAVHFFLVPSKLIIGSISGLSIVLNIATGIPISIWTLIINSFLLVLAYFLIGKEFGLKTVYTALILSPFLAFFERFMPVKESIMKDPWLDLLCFVFILGLAQTILFRLNASTGGLDIIAKIVNKYFHVELGTSVTIAGALICCSAFFVYDLRTVIIGLIGTYMNGLILDHFTMGFNARKRVCIISKEHEQIRDFIVNELHRGASLYHLQGGMIKDEKTEIVSIMTRNEFSFLMDFLKQNEIDSFITAGSVSEIFGNLGTKGNRKKPQSLQIKKKIK